jgi:hypothetical protein
MNESKGKWAREDRVVLGPDTAKRAGKLGLIGEQLALAELALHGFTEIRHLNHPKKNHPFAPFADISAERNGLKFWIGVKTRNKYQNEGTINPCYKIDPRGRALAVQLEQSVPGTIAACIGISVVLSERSCFDGELSNSYSCYFALLRNLTDRQGMGMRKRQLASYEPLAENKPVPALYDLSDCENVFYRQGSPDLVRSAHRPNFQSPHRPDHAKANKSEKAPDQVERYIRTFAEAIRLDLRDLASKTLVIGNRVELLNTIKSLVDELNDLAGRLDAPPSPS